LNGIVFVYFIDYAMYASNGDYFVSFLHGINEFLLPFGFLACGRIMKNQNTTIIPPNITN